MRLSSLLIKREAAALRRQPQTSEFDTIDSDGVEWRAVEEGFRLLEKDLGKLQVRLG